jgi:creatinine amidohydrolase
MKVLLAEMRWPEVKERIRPDSVAVIPVASTEQHGPHLPLATDAEIVTTCAVRAAERVTDDTPTVVTPTVAFGFSEHHMEFAGTLTLSMPTYIAMLSELCESLVRHGFPRILLLNGHGGNTEAIQVVARHVVARHKAVVGAATYWQVAERALAAAGAGEMGLVPGHSAGFETACMLALRPELVDLGQMPKENQWQPLESDAVVTLEGTGVFVPGHSSHHAASGIWGDPTLLDPERGPTLGAAYIGAIVSALADLNRAFSRTEGYGVREGPQMDTEKRG